MVEARLRQPAPDLSKTHDLVRERLNRREAIPAEAHRLVESLRKAGRFGSGSGSADLHARLRAAVTR